MKSLIERTPDSLIVHFDDEEVAESASNTVGSVEGVEFACRLRRYSLVVYTAKLFDREEVIANIEQVLQRLLAENAVKNGDYVPRNTIIAE